MEQQIKETLNEKGYERYNYFYDFVYDLNFESTELWPLDDDIDKRRLIKIYLFRTIEQGNKTISEIFNGLKDMVLELEVVDSELLKKYAVYNERIIKYI